MWWSWNIDPDLLRNVWQSWTVKIRISVLLRFDLYFHSYFYGCSMLQLMRAPPCCTLLWNNWSYKLNDPKSVDLSYCLWVLWTRLWQCGGSPGIQTQDLSFHMRLWQKELGQRGQGAITAQTRWAVGTDTKEWHRQLEQFEMFHRMWL